MFLYDFRRTHRTAYYRRRFGDAFGDTSLSAADARVRFRSGLREDDDDVAAAAAAATAAAAAAPDLVATFRVFGASSFSSSSSSLTSSASASSSSLSSAISICIPSFLSLSNPLYLNPYQAPPSSVLFESI